MTVTMCGFEPAAAPPGASPGASSGARSPDAAATDKSAARRRRDVIFVA